MISVYTETTDTTDLRQREAWVLYDGSCPLCIRLAERFRGRLERAGFRLAPLQTPWVRQRLGLPEEQLLSEMRVLTATGEVLGGAEGVVHLIRAIWWLWPLRLASRLPFGMKLLRWVYRQVASRRRCDEGACERPTGRMP